jgi:hypothetical protein
MHVRIAAALNPKPEYLDAARRLTAASPARAMAGVTGRVAGTAAPRPRRTR